jgi:hypothetical protein
MLVQNQLIVRQRTRLWEGFFRKNFHRKGAEGE